ncbi:craniofacial development protein 1 [Brienomyrus brachyistius]|uniref:craniofacial development protein 1 n=1 Tax=Brienomyrus brachyistius TaxID=42636 RepID=UPI0020B224E4|nr:craniofacial development protein 1 [Brienomyrus brachyistius]
MNISDYDSEDYSSGEDADYIPSDDSLSEDDMNECVKEDGLDTQQDELQSKAVKKKKSKKAVGVRRRKKGVLKLEDNSSKEIKGGEQGTQDEEQGEDNLTVGGEDQEKKRADDLWASFLSDVGPRPKADAAELLPSATDSKATSKKPTETGDTPPRLQGGEQKPGEPAKVTITKVFDFAGEEVRVTKEVDASSKEAKSFLKSKEMNMEPESCPDMPPVTSPAPGPSVKRPAGLGNILNRIGGKKQKMSTLEKSRLDWDAFKDEEGIRDELTIHNRGKDGYLERKNFLERVDHRQFELERSVRLSNMKQ